MVLDKETSSGGTKRAGRVPVRLAAARLNRVPCGDERRQVCSQRLVFFCIRILVYAPWHLADFFASFPLQTDVPVSLRDSAAQETEAWRAARCCESGGDVDGGAAASTSSQQQQQVLHFETSAKTSAGVEAAFEAAARAALAAEPAEEDVYVPDSVDLSRSHGGGRGGGGGGTRYGSSSSSACC